MKFHDAPAWPDLLDPPVVSYDSKAVSSTQPRFAGRNLLIPMIDLNSYRADALVDWIRFRFTTLRKRQAENVRRAVNAALGEFGREPNAYVTGPDGIKKYTGNTFLVTIQDPNRSLVHDVQMSLLKKFRSQELGITPVFTIHSLEVSVDFRVIDANHMDASRRNLLRWQLVEVLRRHLRVNPDYTMLPLARPRVVVGENSKVRQIIKPKVPRYGRKLADEWLDRGFTAKWASFLHKSAYRQPEIDGTYYVGPKEGPVLVRIMDKTTDRRDPVSGRFVTLPAGDERARIEATLFFDHPELKSHIEVAPIGRLEEVHDWKFQAIRPSLFEFFYPTVSNHTWLQKEFKASVTEQEVFKRSGVYGVDQLYSVEQEAMQQNWRLGFGAKPLPLGRNTRLRSFTPLNKKLDRALERLSTAWEPLGYIVYETTFL